MISNRRLNIYRYNRGDARLPNLGARRRVGGIFRLFNDKKSRLVIAVVVK